MDPIADKNFLEFLGKSLIYHQLHNLSRAGLYDFIVVGNTENFEKLRSTLSDRKILEIFQKNGQNPHFSYSEQKDLSLGMAGAILACQDFVKNEPILIVNSNDIVDESAYQMVLDASTDEAFSSFICAKKVHQYFPGGYLEIKNNGEIFRIVEKPGKGKEPSDLVNLVIHLHKNPQKLFDFLSRISSDRDDRYEVSISKMIRDGFKMKAIFYDDFWQAIKYPWHIFPVAHHFFQKAKKGIAENVNIAENAVIKGDVIIEKGVRIFENAVIRGPVFLGENTIVANNALVRESFIGKDCVVGYSTEVARSYLGNNIWMHSNYIGDSIVSDDCSFGAGTVTGNLRLDEREVVVNIQDEKIGCGSNKLGLIAGTQVHCGINTSFMPGIKVGRGSFIGAGIVVSQNIPKGSYVTGQWDFKIVPNTFHTLSSERESMRKKL